MRLRFNYLILLSILLSGVGASALNTPNMSANTLFLYRNSNFHKEDVNAAAVDETPNGFDLREAELQFYADVDPYTRLSLLLSVAPKFTSDGTTVSQEWGIEPEEVFAESNTIAGVTLKLGKFKAAMGKHNTLHTHAYSFIEAPLMNTTLLGDEGFNDTGVSAAVLIPTAWFNEVTLQYLRGKGENTEFNSPSASGGVGVIHWKNLFDLSDELTMELGGSFASGANSFRKTTSLTGADLTFKWRPADGGRYTSVSWASEYLNRNQAQDSMPDEKGEGFASWLQYQFSERWSATYRYDQLTMKDSFDPANLPNDTNARNSIGLTYAASEFASYVLEYDQRRSSAVNSSGENNEQSIFVQANFTIGAHPSHSY